MLKSKSPGAQVQKFLRLDMKDIELLFTKKKHNSDCMRPDMVSSTKE